MSNLTMVGLVNGAPATGTGTVSTIDTLMAQLASYLPLPNGAATSALQQSIVSAIAALGAPVQAGGVVSDSQSAPFAGVVAMVVGVTQAAQRSVRVLCTVAGNAVFQFPDGSTITEPVYPGGQTFPYACTQIVTAGTTATATYYNMK